MTVKAARDILPGEQILVAYTPPFLCTPLRRVSVNICGRAAGNHIVQIMALKYDNPTH